MSLSGELIAAVVVVILASTAFITAGTVTQWNLTSRANAYAMRAIGAVTLISLGAIAAWSRREQPLVAGLVGLASAAAAVAYVRAHVVLTHKLRRDLGSARERASRHGL
ncbi:MAG: hypothetical protein N3B11_05670 [Coriobacteriia bacterium]|nr:hypothetical protein [Coriobacteriia bacterium]